MDNCIHIYNCIYIYITGLTKKGNILEIIDITVLHDHKLGIINNLPQIYIDGVI